MTFCGSTSSTTYVHTPNARLQPQAARNIRIEHDARIEGAPPVGCEPWLGCTRLLPLYPVCCLIDQLLEPPQGQRSRNVGRIVADCLALAVLDDGDERGRIVADA